MQKSERQARRPSVRTQEAERQVQEAERRTQEAERQVQEAERRTQEAERQVQEARLEERIAGMRSLMETKLSSTLLAQIEANWRRAGQGRTMAEVTRGAGWAKPTGIRCCSLINRTAKRNG